MQHVLQSDSRSLPNERHLLMEKVLRKQNIHPKTQKKPRPSLFVTKPANGWIASSRKKPMPKFLFGEFWLEGELSILFADTGQGKSVLAVQIAESIRGASRSRPSGCRPSPRGSYISISRYQRSSLR